MKVKNVLMVSAEVSPFAKTGGLGDVVGSLPRYLNKQDMDVRVLMPLYGQINQKYKDMMKYLGYIYLDLGWRHQYCGIFQLDFNDVIYYFIDNEYYYKHESIYDDMDLEKFAFLDIACFEVCKYVNFKPDVIHAHDWHTGAVCALLNDYYHKDEFFKDTKSVFTIHNLQYQGTYDKNDVLSMLPLDGFKYQNTGVINLLGLGISYSYRVTTVSPTYANEILTDYYGEGLQYLLRGERGKLVGILNGIDTDEYNSKTDKNIYYNFDLKKFKEGKRKNKEGLLEELGFDKENVIDKPLIGIVSRLASQKGMNLLISIINRLLDNDICIVLLGTGDKYIENQFRFISNVRNDRFKALIKFDNTLAHKIYASCDFILMPSAFEPCGLAQMIALRYGTLPIVRSCGGLKDSIIPFNEYTNKGNGFSFNYFSAEDLFHTIMYANNIYYRKDKLDAVIKNGIACDFSWDASAKKYKELYESL